MKAPDLTSCPLTNPEAVLLDKTLLGKIDAFEEGLPRLLEAANKVAALIEPATRKMEEVDAVLAKARNGEIEGIDEPTAEQISAFLAKGEGVRIIAVGREHKARLNAEQATLEVTQFIGEFLENFPEEIALPLETRELAAWREFLSQHLTSGLGGFSDELVRSHYQHSYVGRYIESLGRRLSRRTLIRFPSSYDHSEQNLNSIRRLISFLRSSPYEHHNS